MNIAAYELFAADREFVLTSLLDAPRERVYRAWTDPELLKRWFAPPPWTTPVAELDVRPGGYSLIVMRSPDGREFTSRSRYLDVVENERLVFSNAPAGAARLSGKPFMTGILTFEDEGGKTRHTAHVRRWSQADGEAVAAISRGYAAGGRRPQLPSCT